MGENDASKVGKVSHETLPEYFMYDGEETMEGFAEACRHLFPEESEAWTDDEYRFARRMFTAGMNAGYEIAVDHDRD